MDSSTARSVYRFGGYVLLPGEQQLLVEGKPAALGARAFDLLVTLAQRGGKLVSKTELLDLVWPGVVVEENNLQVHISALRKILGTEAIATIPGRGYRFTLPVESAVEPAATPTLAQGQIARTTSQGTQPTPFDSPLRNALPERLPQLFGRAEDLAALQDLVSQHALVTIVGPGGIGKTRLAAAVVDARRHELTRAVGWVDLAPLSDAAMIPATIAAAFSLPLDEEREPLEALVTVLKKRSVLMVLDNCEHLIDAVATIARALVEKTHAVRLLASSRAPLKVTDERVYRLDPLAVPTNKVSAAEAMRSGAVALFVARARAADRRFEINDNNVDVVVDVCRRLDGIPLAIELAAARLPTLGLPALAAMLDQRFRLLAPRSRAAPARQQTMRATFDWSYALLDETEKIAFRRLGVFAGGFTLEAACAVVQPTPQDEWDVVDALSGLIDKSLVMVDDNDPPRYYLLETGRAYALEKLAQAGETDDLLRGHAAYFSRFFDLASDTRLTTPDSDWRARTDLEVDNLRAALNWALGAGADPSTGIALAGASLFVWLQRDSHFQAEGRRYVRFAAARLNPTIPIAVEARLWFALALLVPSTDPREQLTALERAVALYRSTQSGRALCHALVEYARALTRKGRFRDAEQALGEAQTLLDEAPVARLQGLHCAVSGYHRQKIGDGRSAEQFFRKAVNFFEKSGAEKLALCALSDVADAAWVLGDLDQTVTAFREAAARARQYCFADEDLVASPLGNLAAALIEQGKPEKATLFAEEALALLRETDDVWGLYDALALRLALLGKYQEAARLAGFVDARYASASESREPNEERLRARLFALLRAKFGETELEQRLRAGAEMEADEAYRIAL